MRLCRLGHDQTAQHVKTIAVRMHRFSRLARPLDKQKSVLVDADDFAFALDASCIDYGDLGITKICALFTGL